MCALFARREKEDNASADACNATPKENVSDILYKDVVDVFVLCHNESKTRPIPWATNQDRDDLMNLQELIDKLKSDQIQIKEVLSPYSPIKPKRFVPESLFYLFSCDCAERALLKLKQAGQDLPEDLWAAITTKRGWIVDEMTEVERAEAYRKVYRIEHKMQIDWWLSGGESLFDSNETRDDARLKKARLEATLAVCLVCLAQGPDLLAARIAEKTNNVATQLQENDGEEERDWQSRRFAWLLSHYNNAGEEWLSTLSELPPPEDAAL